MPPVLLVMAPCICAADRPALVDVASGPWQLAQLLAYRVGPSVTGGVVGGVVVGGVAGFRAVTMACCWALVSEERYPMPPVLFDMAVCSRASVIPFLLDVANAPWQLAQLLA